MNVTSTFAQLSRNETAIPHRSIADDRWHRVNVERIGKLVRLTVLSEGEDKSLLNNTKQGSIQGQKQVRENKYLHLNKSPLRSCTWTKMRLSSILAARRIVRRYVSRNGLFYL